MKSHITALIKKELGRQRMTLDLIPSENIASPAVLNAIASPFINKYAEGYPGRRYYPGNAVADELETYVQQLIRKVFLLDESYAVNVQPHSGSPANLAVYMALLSPGDPFMGLELSHGGHLTHGHKVSATGKLFTSIKYFVNQETGLLDYGAVRDTAKRFMPKLIVSGATAYPRRIDFKKFHDIAKEVGAYSMADISHIAGLVGAGLHPSPFPFTDIVTFTTHKTLRGPRGAVIVGKKEVMEKIDKAVFPGLQGGPHLHTIAGIGVALEEALKPSYKTYQIRVIKNAIALADELLRLGYTLVTGGTDTHLLLLDLRQKNIQGKIAQDLLEEVGIIANRNTVPGDTKPFDPSGVRMGTPSVTSRGMGEREMHSLAQLIHDALTKKRPLNTIHKDVLKLCKKFPLPY
ncbi:MAG: serine hydroxymethyltransferase [bacterium]|nr:serine hydroxymethyltransferase [bacterium]